MWGDGQVKVTIDPTTGEVVTRVFFASEAQVDAAIAAVKSAQAAWGALSVAERVEIGGFKQSGVGRALGEDGPRDFTNATTISIHPRWRAMGSTWPR